MSFAPFLERVRAALTPALNTPSPSPVDLLPLLTLSPELRPTRVLPWGRYLLALEPGFNAQLDVFSTGYVGGMHRHGTWGVFYVLAGALISEDCTEDRTPIRVAQVPTGGSMGFAPPHDWHRVSTPTSGPQTVSIHLYGPGFDLDTGEALGPDGQPRTYTRGAWANPAALDGAFEDIP